MLELAIIGAAGRMGRTLLEAAHDDADVRVTAASEHPDSDALGSDAGALIGRPESGVKLCASLQECVDDFAVAIDFTRPANSLQSLDICARHGKAIVIGTTGFDETQKTRLGEYAERIPVVWAPNMSVGVNLTLQLLATAAQVLGDGYDVEITEAHHRYKVDAPSGTALRMGEVVAAALGRDLEDCAVYGREGHTGERDAQTIGFATVRGGDIVGEHTVMFAGTGERIEITHRASSRSTFAYGALRAARWVSGRPAGLYGMQDVLAT
ncbi:MAG: 4-hydroxy-tetrahydrodipicolinate reductase [Gammaproteobacteria bacterium]|nr:4-hydroxy-tetrahydrodipicolinate reductase [Gammaproteobacteria bacterium]